MSNAYVIGHITVKDPQRWADYRSQVPATLAPWGGELVFRGTRLDDLSGRQPHADVVVIRFPDQSALDAWHASPAYQALIPLRTAAADIVLTAYGT